MIVRMENTADVFMIDAAVSALESKGCEIQVRNGEGEEALVIAFGPRVDTRLIRRLAGVKRCEKSHKLYFDTNGKGFEEAWRFREINKKTLTSQF